MNELLKKLYDKSYETKPVYVVDSQTGEAVRVTFQGNPLGQPTFSPEKFAELIVRECAKIADDGFASSNFGNGITGHQLLKHFGVE